MSASVISEHQPLEQDGDYDMTPLEKYVSAQSSVSGLDIDKLAVESGLPTPMSFVGIETRECNIIYVFIIMNI